MKGKKGSGVKHNYLKAVAGAVLFSITALLAFTLPDHPDAIGLGAFLRLPLEWPLIAVLVLITRGWLRQLIIFLAGFVVFLILFLKIADIGVETAFQRQFNPYLDVKMMRKTTNPARKIMS